MSKSIAINIETQTANNEIISVCHINEKMLALETSYQARKMFKLNRNLFDKIVSTTKITSGVLYRQEVIRDRGSTNSVYSRVEDSYEFKEIELSRLFFENNILRKQRRAINSKGRKFDYDPNNIESSLSKGLFNDQKITLDDLRDSRTLATIEEVPLFDNGIKTIIIRDTLKDSLDLLEVGYRIQISVETDFSQYVKYVVDKAEKSTLFLKSYISSLDVNSNYDPEADIFSSEFSSRILEDLGLDQSLDSVNLSNSLVLNSEFGQVGVSLYNLAYLISPKASKNLYSSCLKGILPTLKTTRDNIILFLNNLEKFITNVKYHYYNNDKQTKKEKKFSRVSEGKLYTNLIEASTKSKLKVEQEILGYSVFSDSDGLNVFSSEKYKRRWALEQAKYYPNISIEDTTKYLSPSENSAFSSIANAASFLTPTSLRMGTKKISTSRGMKNINVNDIRQFRLAKSARVQQQRTAKRQQSTKSGRIDTDVLSSLNVTVSTAKETLLNRSTSENIDPLIDSKFYIGDSSEFSTNNPTILLKQFKRKLTESQRRALEISSDIVPRAFLRRKGSINSAKDIQFSNPKSIVRSMSEPKRVIPDTPPHIKYMMSKGFNPNPNSDPFKNRESSQIIDETMKNLYVIKALVGFKKNSLGLHDVSSPIYERISNSILQSRKPILAKAYDYEVPELGILKDKFIATIYNNLIYIKGS